MSTTRIVLGFDATGKRVHRGAHKGAAPEITSQVRAEQIVRDGEAAYAVVTDGAGRVLSEIGDNPAHTLLTLAPGRTFTVGSRAYTRSSGADSYAATADHGIRYRLRAFNAVGTHTWVTVSALSRITVTG